MVDKKAAQAYAKGKIEDYMTLCKTEDIAEALEAANIMVWMALNLAETLSDPNVLTGKTTHTKKHYY